MMRLRPAAALLAGLLVVAGAFVLFTRTAADPPRVWWVLFDTVAAASDRPVALSAAAIENRRRAGLPLLAGDRPVPDALIHLVEREGGRIRFVSRWLRGVSAELDPGEVRRLARHPAVRELRPVAQLAIAGGSAGSVPTGGAGSVMQAADSAFYGPNWPALRDLGIPTTHVIGFTGRGVRIAILDTGFETAHEALATRQVIGTRDFVDGDSDVSDADDAALAHGTRVWSILGGYRPGTVVGPAYDAQFLLARVDAEPGDTRADEDRWVAALEWADSAGARIINSAVVYRWEFTDRAPYDFAEMNGDSTITTRAADAAARRGIVVVTAIGNHGPQSGTLSAPADADSIISVGAVNDVGAPATFPDGASARGPTFDNRMKPEVSARGVDLIGANSAGTSSYATDLAGTSYAAALIAGASAAFIQAWPELTPAAVRRALIQAGRRAGNRDNAVGAGVPEIPSAILFPEGLSPTGVATVDLNGALTTIAPTFSWSAPLVAGQLRPVLYRVEIATDPVFDNVIARDTVREAFALRTSTPIKPSLALWWRVVATGALGVRRVSATAGPISMPAWVRLVSPAPAQVTFVDSAQPMLRWTPVEAPPPLGPFTYQVEVLSAESGELAQPPIRDVTTSSVRVPQPLAANTAFRWRVIARTQTGVADTAESASPFVITSVARPPATLLYQNFPNPFPTQSARVTRIWFDLAEDSRVELAIFDLRARLVRRLIPSDPSCGSVTLEAGQYGRSDGVMPEEPCVQTTWDGTDADGRAVPRGIYVLRLRAAGREEYRQIVFLGQ